MATGIEDSRTDLLTRPPGPRGPRRPPAGPPARPLSVLGITAALQAAGLGVLAVMVLVLVGWATTADSGASATTAVTGALQAWLVAHHTRLLIPQGTFDLVPLGLTLLPLVLVHVATLRAGRAVAVRGRRGVVALTSSVTATYALAVTLVAVLAQTPEVRPVPLSAFVGSAAVALIASGSAAVRATGRSLVLWHRLPETARTVLPPAAAGTAVLVGGGAAVAGLSLAAHHDQARALTTGLDAGLGGSLLLLLGCLLYVPTAALWGLAFCLGPGFAVGEGTSVAVTGSDLGAVPAVPLLAALPAGTGSPMWWAALGVPLGAGCVAGLVAHRRATAGAHSWRALAETAALVGAAVGVTVAALAWLAAGSAGPGRMAEVGPSWWAAGPAAALEVALAMAATSTALVLRRRA